jgi:hypothetical protein
MKQKYLEYFKLNKNILIGLGASIVVSAIIAQTLAEQADAVNTTYTLIVDYVVYFSVFGVLYYYDNRKKYMTDDGTVDKKLLRQDMIKIISSLGVGEIIYTLSRWMSHYHLLGIDYEPYLASIISQIISTIIYMIAINISVKFTRLYRDDN